MFEGLQTEIDAHPELTGASKEIIINALNADGTAQVESWAVRNNVLKVPKGDILALMGVPSIANVVKWMRAEADDNALAFHTLYDSHDQFIVTNSVFRAFVGLLHSLGKITAGEQTAILRLGERKISRAEELWSRFITAEDFS